MSAQELIRVAESNIDKLALERQQPSSEAAPPAPAPQQTQDPVPPTTQNTPIQTPVTFDSMAELALARVEGRWQGTNEEYNALADSIINQ